MICVAIAFAQACVILEGLRHPSTIPRLLVDVLFFIGQVGVIPFLMVNGVHGDIEGAAGVVGGASFVLVNAAVYYGIVVGILRLRRRFKPGLHK